MLGSGGQTFYFTVRFRQWEPFREASKAYSMQRMWARADTEHAARRLVLCNFLGRGYQVKSIETEYADA